tara:strand:- start:1143 stop:1724 length:582 start_codon:yes stop_codon:yes gene_type:complete
VNKKTNLKLNDLQNHLILDNTNIYYHIIMSLFLSALLIFVLRLIDQSLTTVRALVVTKKPVLGAFIGLVESAIWILAVSQVIKDINDPFLIAAYAFGFAAGTLLGIQLEKFIGLGSAVVRVFTPSKSANISKPLRDKGFMVTDIKAKGRDGSVTISWCIVPRRKLSKVLSIIRSVNPDAYVTTDFANPTSLRK